MHLILVRRLLTLPFVLLGVASVLFAISILLPSDPARLLAGDGASPEVIATIRSQLGLDQPVWVQFWEFMSRLARGDFGISVRFGVPVWEIIKTSLPASIQLLLAGVLVAVCFAIPMGYLAAKYRGRWIDVVIRTVAVFGASTPSFVMAVGAIVVFGYYLDMFPVSGTGGLSHLILPALVLGLHDAGNAARILRARMIDEMNEDHARAARARGIPHSSVLRKNGFRNALLPTVTDLGISLADLAGSLILVETIFSWPGIGNLLRNGILWNDFPLVSGVVLVLVFYAVCINLVIDIAYRFIDPRLR